MTWPSRSVLEWMIPIATGVKCGAHRVPGRLVLLHTRRKPRLVSLRIRDLEERLPNPPFLRVHLSHIVNLDHVDRVVGLDDSRFEAPMKNGAVVPVSRARSQEVRVAR